ncbi:MAG: phosphate acyltransferase PlsX [Syntrophomonadaceae bacterium]
MRIAVDVMGGDYAPAEIIAGALEWAAQNDSQLLLVGEQDVIAREMESYTGHPGRVSIVHASEVVGMNEAPALALRKKKDSSIMVATKLVKTGEADAVVSCGNTGAQMAAAVFILDRLEGIERPPIVAAVPNISGKFSLLIDVGANVDCRPGQLLQFALLGNAYARVGLGIENPRIGLLNNGEEETKGNAQVVEGHKLMKNHPELNFIGNIEGRDLFNNKCDVIVCDGFTGNIVLKTVEGLAMIMAGAVKKELKQSLSIFKHFDYTQVGGAPLLGINGISIVCHGSSKRQAVYNGIRIAAECVQQDIVTMQKEALSR